MAARAGRPSTRRGARPRSGTPTHLYADPAFYMAQAQTETLRLVQALSEETQRADTAEARADKLVRLPNCACALRLPR